MTVNNPNIPLNNLETTNDFVVINLGQKNGELLLNLGNKGNNNGKKSEKLEPGTLEASNLRVEIIKFLESQGFELVDSNKHEKYKNRELNITVVVPHQHGYFAKNTFCKILREAGYSKKDYIVLKNKKKKGDKVK